MQEKYQWLDCSNARKYMSDRTILNKYVDLDESCLMDKEKKQVMDMIHKFKHALCLIDKIVICLNIEVEIDVTNEPPFFIRPILLYTVLSV